MQRELRVGEREGVLYLGRPVWFSSPGIGDCELRQPWKKIKPLEDFQDLKVSSCKTTGKRLGSVESCVSGGKKETPTMHWLGNGRSLPTCLQPVAHGCSNEDVMSAEAPTIHVYKICCFADFKQVLATIVGHGRVKPNSLPLIAIRNAKNSKGTINSILVLYGAQIPEVILLFTPAIHRYYLRVSLLPIYEKKAWLALVATNSSHHNLRTGVILSYGMCTQSGCSRSCFVLICAELTRG